MALALDVTVGRLFSGLAVRAARRPLLTIAAARCARRRVCDRGAGLRPTAATDTLVGSSSSTYKNTQSFYKHFGEEPVEVLVKGDLRKLVLSSDIDRLVGLEGCMSASLPAAALPQEGGVNGPCGQLTRAKRSRWCSGPARSSTRRLCRWTSARLAQRPSRSTGQAGAEHRLPQGARKRAGRAGGRGAWRRSTQGHDGGLRRGNQRACDSLWPEQRPHPRRPRIRLEGRVRSDQAIGHSQPTLRLPLPESRSGARLDTPEGRSLRSAALAHDRLDSPGHGDEPVAPAKRRDLPGHRRARDRQRRHAARSRIRSSCC